jgi:AraC-like DNA-binding protein
MTTPLLASFSNQVSHSKYSFPRQHSRVTRSSAVECIGRERCNPDYILERGEFGAHGIEFVSSGRGEILLNRKKYTLRPGTLFCYGPGTPHRITTDSNDPMTKYFVDASGTEIGKMLRGTKIQPGRVFYTPEPDQFQTLFESMLSEGAKGLPQTHEICLAYFRILILKTEGASSTTSPSINQMASSFQACKKAIDANFTTLKDLADIARQVHLSPAYVCRLFRKFGHQSPFQYLILKKLNHAASLLLADAASVKAVAFEVGYSDPYHFSKSFSRFFEISPAKFAATHSRKPH